MKGLKKGAVLLLAAALCIGSSAGTTRAAGCSHSRMGDRPQIDEYAYDYQHKVMRNLYVGNQQLYSICHVEQRNVYAVKQCIICYYEQKTLVRSYGIHSLASDPDHN